MDFLRNQGYKIIEHNFKNSLGEIDIIAQDKGDLCFVEVKTRKTERFGSPFEAISKTKQRKLSQVALSYLKDKNLFNKSARFDVVGIVHGNRGKVTIELLKNAFELTSPYAY